MSDIKKARIDKRQTKPDDGIATVPAPMSTGEVKSFKIKEEIRDILNKRPHGPQRKESTPDTMTTQELINIRYSGYRLNTFTNQIELWVLGAVRASENATKAAQNPALLADMHERVFHTVGSVVEVDLKTDNAQTPPKQS